MMGFTPNVNIGYEFEDGKFLGTMAAPGVINRDFTWVRSEMYNVGVEFSVLRNKLNFELDFYKKHKSGKLKIREATCRIRLVDQCRWRMWKVNVHRVLT